jgi:hypothetical protein
LFKGKLLVAVLGSVTIAGGITAVEASAAAIEQRIVHTSTGPTSATSVAVVRHAIHTIAGSPTTVAAQDANGPPNACPGFPEAQQLAAKFSLSADSNSDDLPAICALHEGAFQGTTSSGATISSSRVFGYGEIEELLNCALYLASHDKASMGSILTSDDTRNYLTEALHNCGMASLETCLKTNIPGFHPGSGNDGGKPATLPIPGEGRPGGTPTPHH